MKKIISIILSVFLLATLSPSVFAWSVPWDISSDDNVNLFFGEVVSYYPKKDCAAVAANKIIKGDIRRGAYIIVENIREFLIPGNTYIFATFQNETYVFYPDSYDLSTLRLSDRSDPHDEVEGYINDGSYKKADDIRIDTANKKLGSGEPVSLAEALGLQENPARSFWVDNEPHMNYAEFYRLCREITLFPTIKGTDSSLVIRDFAIGDMDFTLTSDAKLIINHGLEVYTLSPVDRDRLNSFIPAEENLPPIHLGSVVIFICSIILLSLIIFCCVLLLIIKNRRGKRKEAKRIQL